MSDEFLVGVNLPWLTYGGDFGANRWHPDGGVARPAQRALLRSTLAPLSDLGVEVVRWFVLTDGRAGLRDDAGGGLLGLDAFVLRDLDAAVDEVERAGLRAIFVLLDFHWFRPARVVHGVQTGGRRSIAIDPAQRSLLLDHVIRPILERCGTHPAIAAWDVINEPEWVTRTTRFNPWSSRVARSNMRTFIGAIVDLIHQVTVHAATVGCASTRSLPLVRGLELDLYQAHWYDKLDRRAPLCRPVADLGLDRPLLLGEFPTRGSVRSPSDIIATARANGYAGALSWSVLANDMASDHAGFVRSRDLARSQTPLVCASAGVRER